jgi:hypothetical protein
MVIQLYPFEHTSSCTCNISNLVFDIVLRTWLEVFGQILYILESVSWYQSKQVSEVSSNERINKHITAITPDCLLVQFKQKKFWHFN